MARKKTVDFKVETGRCVKNFPVADCRSYGISAEIQPWIAISSGENWDDDCFTPQGLPDGDMPRYDCPFVPLHELDVADFFGNPIPEEMLESGDFHPNDIDFFFKEDEETDLWVAPTSAGGGINFYINPHRKMKAGGKVVKRYY